MHVHIHPFSFLFPRQQKIEEATTASFRLTTHTHGCAHFILVAELLLPLQLINLLPSLLQIRNNAFLQLHMGRERSDEEKGQHAINPPPSASAPAAGGGLSEKREQERRL
jgi:hypothetical protein